MKSLSNVKEKIVVEIFCGGDTVKVKDVFIHWNNEVSANNFKDVQSLTLLFNTLLETEEMNRTLDEAKNILKKGNAK